MFGWRKPRLTDVQQTVLSTTGPTPSQPGGGLGGGVGHPPRDVSRGDPGLCGAGGALLRNACTRVCMCEYENVGACTRVSMYRCGDTGHQHCLCAEVARESHKERTE